MTGASKGIGRGIALCFGAAGCRVMVVPRWMIDHSTFQN
jgi:NAD(P)-dependent dehydrogenase (short-subunit alcohol dehydrogenase family)